MSSFGETNRVANHECTFLPFELKKMIHHEFDTDVLQEEYYVITGFDELTKALDELGLIFSRKIEF